MYVIVYKNGISIQVLKYKMMSNSYLIKLSAIICVQFEISQLNLKYYVVIVNTYFETYFQNFRINKTIKNGDIVNKL